VTNAMLDAVLDYVRHGHRLVLLHEVLPNGTCSCGNRSGTCPSGTGKDSTAKHPRSKQWIRNLIMSADEVIAAWTRHPTLGEHLKSSQSGTLQIQPVEVADDRCVATLLSEARGW
jgi:hypothetical protein